MVQENGATARLAGRVDLRMLSDLRLAKVRILKFPLYDFLGNFLSVFCSSLMHKHPAPSANGPVKRFLTNAGDELGIFPSSIFGQPFLVEVVQGVLGTSKKLR